MPARRPDSRRRSPQGRRRRRRPARCRKLLLAVLIIALLAIFVFGLAILVDRIEVAPPQAYPMEYTALIQENAALQGFDPAYAAAIILAESGYDPQAVSSVNAQGLMQILPDTGIWLAGKFDEEYVEGCLFDPATNIRYGCWYLGYLLRRYDGDLTLSTAAYHSGQGTVDKWLQNPQYSSDGKTLQVIAGTKTNAYVGKVLNYYEKYAQLYADLP